MIKQYNGFDDLAKDIAIDEVGHLYAEHRITAANYATCILAWFCVGHARLAKAQQVACNSQQLLVQTPSLLSTSKCTDLANQTPARR